MKSLLLYPEVFERGIPKLSSLGKTVARNALLVAQEPIPTEPVTVAVRTWNEAESLEETLRSFERQLYDGDVQFVIVDNDSTDGTKDVAKDHGAKVVNLPDDEFSYARSMNMCMEAADNPWVYLTVGHAVCVTTVTLAASMRHVHQPRLTGVYSTEVAGIEASNTDRMFNLIFRTHSFKSPPYAIKKVEMGAMSATSALLSREAWLTCPFDERYGMGGEDTVWARAQLDLGNVIIRDPAMATHHSHGLNPIDFFKQIRQWRRTGKGPQTFDRENVLARRPDHRKRLNKTKE